jgi:hypothetical protein
MSLLNVSPIARTRRHHALEHATIQVLNQRFPALRLVGWSTHEGFYVYGPVATQDVQSAVAEALARLQRGESHLAVHPRCGTNLVTGGTLAGLVAFLAMLPGDHRSRRERLPLVILLSTLALLLAQPLGLLVQQHVTTSADLGPATAAEIDTRRLRNGSIHRVRLVS